MVNYDFIDMTLAAKRKVQCRTQNKHFDSSAEDCENSPFKYLYPQHISKNRKIQKSMKNNKRFLSNYFVFDKTEWGKLSWEIQDGSAQPSSVPPDERSSESQSFTRQ
ncbi:hypothetical protein FDP41_005919 [Naegleria fowleri]|uniref:Uncharacterized protein n=1 Tax=Naegleria fowleri TaxID=5763 RepID=A0A6A5BJW9_NAEFO|nr:uncharacterized protein FDP41_005919 [Naegleria fowleri]KAF0975166.1 hypothetical protein FDP41_005919 [Naegleria fowleri]CAG4719158.1 unnamed protein product [Naegleria fowleri]